MLKKEENTDRSEPGTKRRQPEINRPELPPAARRALAEAAARRAEKEADDRPKEIDGRDGPDPVRYGDWEVKGLASDF